MKMQSLAVIFIMIILPISLVLSSYTQNRVNTINLQTRYDSKLNDATYDALKAYQLNSFTSSDTSFYTNEKIRNIEASANTFFNSMASGFSELGYTKSTLQNYVPALVFTMYDGYYIYSPYTNTWDDETIEKMQKQEKDYKTQDPSYETSYKNGEILYDLKPYVYYSCRYRQGNDSDVIITYSLDNYIQIQGKVDGNTVSKYGYVLDDISVSGDTVSYHGITINKENCVINEKVYVDGDVTEPLPCIKINGTKYYLDGDTVFSVLNGKKQVQSNLTSDNFTQNINAMDYYREAHDLTNYVKSHSSLFNTANIVDIDTGKKYQESGNENPYTLVGNIFEDDVEAEDSNFNTHRIDVIKYSIERNLSVAISNFNNYSGVIAEFQMPKLKDTDWVKIMDNISIISFLQGINIGGKIYNGYAIVTNTKNEDVVMEDSIYIQDKTTNTFHRITEKNLNSSNIVGIYNINIERRTASDSSGNTTYYFPVSGTLSYDSIVTQNNIDKKSNQTLSEYVSGLSENLRKVYYTALGRERYGLYRQKLKI